MKSQLAELKVAEAAETERRLRAELAENQRTAAETERRLRTELAENQHTAAETERRLRAEAAETERRLRAEVDKVNARSILTSELTCTRFVDFQTLIEHIDRCHLDVIPGVYLDEYLNSQQDANTSMTYVNASASSVTDRERTSNELPLNKMRRRMTEETPDKIRLNELTLNDKLMETILCKVLFAENVTEFEKFLQSYTESLDKVRQMLYYILQQRKVREVSELQGIAALFLEDFTRYFHSNALTLAGQIISLEGELMVGIATEMSKKKIKGFTDLVLCESNDCGLADALCIFELKAPQKAMYHSGAYDAKDQLLFEMEMVGQMHTNGMLLGGLLDMFSIAVAVRLVDEGGKIFYMSNRVTNSRSFLLRLLLLLCKDKDEVWTALQVFSTIEIPLPIEEDGGGGAGAGESQKDREKEEKADVGETSSRSLRSSDIKGCVRAGGVSREVVEEIPNPIFKEEYDEEVSRMLSWDAKRKGLTLLTASALNRASKEQQSEPGETLKWRSSFFRASSN